MPGPDSVKRRRLRLFSEDPHCWYCGCRVYEYGDPGGGTQKPDQSTLEHLISRRNPMRRTDISEYIRARVLACYACNNARGEWTSALQTADHAEWRAADQAWNVTIGELVMSR